jgi:hypothetical protein
MHVPENEHLEQTRVRGFGGEPVRVALIGVCRLLLRVRQYVVVDDDVIVIELADALVKREGFQKQL